MAQSHLTLPDPVLPLRPTVAGGFGLGSAYRALQGIGYALFGILIVLIAFGFTEPSPYDFVAIPTILLWLALGIRVTRPIIFFLGLLLVYLLGLFLAVVPQLAEADSVTWTATSAYLALTAVFFAMFFSADANLRARLAFNAFTVACLVAAVAGIMGYFDVLGTGDLFSQEGGRASGTFKDPNVLGSFLIPGVLFVVRDLLTGEGRRPVLAVVVLPVLLTGVLLSFSRGAWAATIIGTLSLVGLAFAASRSGRVRRRIAFLSVVTVIVGGVCVVGLLALDNVRLMFETRAQVTQDYDEGVTGRFGNQLRAIPLLVERPNGFGPVRYRFTFGFDPHNSYVGAFANGGWMGGFAFIGLMLATAYVGLRLSLTPSPFQRYAQVAWAAHLTLVLQSFQIDIDHWRHAYLVWGMIWGLEAARVSWVPEVTVWSWPGSQAGIPRSAFV